MPSIGAAAPGALEYFAQQKDWEYLDSRSYPTRSSEENERYERYKAEFAAVASAAARANLSRFEQIVDIGLGAIGSVPYASSNGGSTPQVMARAKVATDLHHPLPKFLGGFPDQVRSKLPTAVHTEFHGLLWENLKAAGIPLPIGGSNGSTAKWADYFVRFPGTQRIAFDAVLRASRSTDMKHGTNITQDVWQNVMEHKFKAYP